ncbi:Tkl protein kinase, partial [Globisporangium splendens]
MLASRFALVWLAALASPLQGAATSLVTSPASCTKPTLKLIGVTDVGIVCDQLTVDKVPLAGITSLDVGVLSDTLTITALVIESLTSIGNASDTRYTGERKTIQFNAGFSELKQLTTLSFTNVLFQDPNIVLTTAGKLTNLVIDNTNAQDVSLKIAEGEQIVLTSIDLLRNSFTKLPKVLYERQYISNSIKADVDVPGQTFEVLDAASYQTLSSNLAATGVSFELSNSCDFKTMTVGPSGAAIAGGKYKVCDASTAVGTPPARDTNSTSSTTPMPVAADTDSSKSSSSDTTMIVLIVLIAAIVLTLAAYLFRRHYLSKRRSAAQQTNDNTVNLIGKVDTTSSGKAIVTSDEALRNFRLENPVVLTKPAGAGRLWIGEYNREKVIVKRIEAEVSDPYVTKSLINQACVLAPLSHANIVKFMGVTWVAGTDFAVVAEYMDKDNLKTVLSDAEWELDMEAKLGICLNIARALAYLHNSEQNMYVRSLSSRKVLVNSSLECKINLFDCYPCLKKFPAVESYGSGEIIWQAPEIITRAARIDLKKANIYAFGVIMCEILSRSSPFQSLIDELGNTRSDVEIVKRVRRKEVLIPHEHHQEYMFAPESLRNTIKLCLSINPGDRPSAEDIIMLLQDAKVEEIAASLRTGGDFFV